MVSLVGSPVMLVNPPAVMLSVPAMYTSMCPLPGGTMMFGRTVTSLKLQGALAAERVRLLPALRPTFPLTALYAVAGGTGTSDAGLHPAGQETAVIASVGADRKSTRLN